jgi:hypothetical protein
MYGKERLEEIVRKHPDSFPAVELLKNFDYFIGLHEAIGKKWIHGWGSYLFDGIKYEYNPRCLRKQEELYRYSMSATNILEIGVYVGHSLLLMLIANPKCRITCIDIDASISEPAVNYLNAHFGDRVTFIKGDAVTEINKLVENQFDLVHIDADHVDSAVTAQFNASLRVSKMGSYYVFDDYEAVRRSVDGFAAKGMIKHCIVPGCLWTNCISQLISKTVNVIELCRPYSALSRERLQNNIDAVTYLDKNNIEGDIVEIGVYKGGSMLSMLKTHEQTRRAVDRIFHLYDTFSGMTPPCDLDKDYNGYSAKHLMEVSEQVKCIAPLELVKSNINSNTSIDEKNIKYHVGDILKNTFYPDKIALLRLDTDWYELTKFELLHFYPKVVQKGVVIIDDFGHWIGCRKAVYEFLADHPEIKLIPIDDTGVYFYKP